mmetsp:Transcript_68429/g.178158  ORF Transcript_68429/g.178158 Transcript_68429/m.178158 type:complete len:314 (+) Transcript_68429:313-1254(+)
MRHVPGASRRPLRGGQLFWCCVQVLPALRGDELRGRSCRRILHPNAGAERSLPVGRVPGLLLPGRQRGCRQDPRDLHRAPGLFVQGLRGHAGRRQQLGRRRLHRHPDLRPQPGLRPGLRGDHQGVPGLLRRCRHGGARLGGAGHRRGGLPGACGLELLRRRQVPGDDFRRFAAERHRELAPGGGARGGPRKRRGTRNGHGHQRGALRPYPPDVHQHDEHGHHRLGDHHEHHSDDHLRHLGLDGAEFRRPRGGRGRSAGGRGRRAWHRRQQRPGRGEQGHGRRDPVAREAAPRRRSPPAHRQQRRRIRHDHHPP